MHFLRHEPPPCNPLAHAFNEKAPSSNFSHSRLSPLSSDSQNRLPLSFQSHRAMSSAGHCSRRISYTRPRGLRICNLMRSWLPIISYVATTVAFFIAIALYRDQLFASLDQLSHWLRADEMYGHAVMFALIFITTFPPIPLYSTLIILSGYTFGPWTGAIISYFAALTGALTVFILSRALLRDSISRWLATYTSIKRVVCAIEKRPKLLFLIRLAPYPYNVMNCLLAAAPTLTLHSYTVCTALSLFKVIIHTSLGASIHSFKDYHHHHNNQRPNSDSPSQDQGSANTVARMWTIVGILLCVFIFVYLSIVARRAVDDELEDEDGRGDNEETVAFLSPYAHTDCEAFGDPVDDDASRVQAMVESPFRASHQMLPVSASPDGRRQEYSIGA